MSMLDGEWAKAVGAEFKKPYYRDLYNFVRDEYATHVVYPPADSESGIPDTPGISSGR